jgi:hypothetical protein
MVYLEFFLGGGGGGGGGVNTLWFSLLLEQAIFDMIRKSNTKLDS